VTGVEPPDRADSHLHLLLAAQPRADFIECQIRLLGNEFEQPLLVPLEWRPCVARSGLLRYTASLRPTLDPADRGRGADIEQTRSFSPTFSLLNDRNQPFPEILRVSSSHRATPPLSSSNSNLICRSEGIPCYCSDSGQPENALVSVSDAQCAPIPYANFHATVQHGLPLDLLKLIPNPRRNYLAFLGRISPEKGVDRAVAIARAANLPLKIAAKIDRLDESYFHSTIAPLLQPPHVEFVGEIDEVAKEKFLGDALALLFPIDWPEPFWARHH